MDAKKPRVLYDHQIFTLQRFGGISRYFAELMMQFKITDAVDFNVVCKYSNNYYLRENTKLQFANKSLYSEKKVSKFAHYGLNIIQSKSVINKGNYDVFHPTYYDPYFLKNLKAKPFVITVHDLTHDLFPEFFENPGRNTSMKKAVLSKADKIIAISENTKKDIIDIYNVPGEKITVIYHGNSLKKNGNMSNGDVSAKPGNRYILFIGLRGGYKNFKTFVQAVSQILRIDETLEVICVGAGPFSKEENEMLSAAGMEKRFTQKTVEDEQLIALYSDALALVFPSLYEGFGMPILEAMDCGCPAILSNTSSMPEIGGEAACYFDPKDVENMRESIEKVIYNESLRQLLILNGRKQAEKFSWAKTAEETSILYQSLI